jgi:hypothetical protein
MKEKLFFTGLIGIMLIIFMTGCPPVTGDDGKDSQTHSFEYKLGDGDTLTITGEGDVAAPKTGDAFELVINGKKLTGTIEVKSDGTIIFKNNSGGEAFTAGLDAGGGSLTVGGGEITFDDGSKGTVQEGTAETDAEAKAVTITGFPDKWNGRELQAGLFETQTVSGTPAVLGVGTVQSGKVKVDLYANGKPWKGTGSWYVAFGSANSNTYYITKSTKSFSSGSVTAAFSDFEEKQTGGGQGSDRGQQIGKITGTITLTDIPNPKPSWVSIVGRDSNYNWRSYDSQISLDGVNGSTATNIAWTIPLYENDSNGSLKDQGGTKEVYFRLYVQPSGSNSGFEITIGGTKTLDLSDKNNIVVGNLGSVSIASVKLSGTITINNGGQPLPGVSIQANTPNGNSSIGSVWLESPATAGAVWEIYVPVQQGNAVTFSVYGYDSPNGGDSVYRKSGIVTSETASVSNQPIGNIKLDIGDVSVGRLSGTVSFSALPSPPPYEIFVQALAYYPVGGNGNDWIWMENTSYSVITRNGNTGRWSTPKNDEFLEALKKENQMVVFYIALQLNQNENQFDISRQEIEVSKNNLSAIDLGSIAVPNYIKLSGTFTGTYNGAAPPYVSIYARPEGISGDFFGSSANISSPAPGAAWYLYIPVLDSPTKIIFDVSSWSGSTTLFSSLVVSPSNTSAVSNQPVSGIVIDIGDVRPNTLRVVNNPQGTYTVYVTESSISNSNYDSVKNNYKATGTGNGSSVSLTWSSGSSNKSYCILITAGSVTKYKNWVYFTNGIGSVDWNTMTEATGGGGGNEGGTFRPEIDASLQGTWVDTLTGNTLTMTITGSGITWGGTAGSVLNTTTSAYQGTGYSFVWIAKDGNISYKFSYLGGTPTTIPVYGYTISGSSLTLTVGGVAFVTMNKQ